MLKFFVPLMEDCHVSVIYYTGKEELSTAEIMSLQRSGKIFIQASRPTSLTETVSTLITKMESLGTIYRDEYFSCKNYSSLDQLSNKKKKNWCIFYCGGSKRIRDQFKEFAKTNGIDFEFELFDW